MATVLVGALERLATVFALQLYPRIEERVEVQISALANLIAVAMRGG